MSASHKAKDDKYFLAYFHDEYFTIKKMRFPFSRTLSEDFYPYGLNIFLAAFSKNLSKCSQKIVMSQCLIFHCLLSFKISNIDIHYV